MHLVGFIIRIYHNARSPERQIFLSVGTVRTMHRKQKTAIYFILMLILIFRLLMHVLF